VNAPAERTSSSIRESLVRQTLIRAGSRDTETNELMVAGVDRALRARREDDDRHRDVAHDVHEGRAALLGQRRGRKRTRVDVRLEPAFPAGCEALGCVVVAERCLVQEFGMLFKSSADWTSSNQAQVMVS
jgi:hypothetical protein